MPIPVLPSRFVAEVIVSSEGNFAKALLEPRARPVAISGEAPAAGAIVIVVKRPQIVPPCADATSSTCTSSMPHPTPESLFSFHVEGAPLATPESARARLFKFAADEGLGVLFPEAVDREVDAIASASSVDDPTLDPALDDLEALPFVTIDGPFSRDLDQALFVSRDGDTLVVHYAIADAAHFVRPGTALFEEALRRGTSFYLPGLVIPMLPRALSEGMISLNPDGPRRAVVFISRVALDGSCSSTTITRARIHSRAKLSFPQVQHWYDAPEGNPLGDAEYGESLRLLAEVGRRRMREADTRQVVRYRRLEVEVEAADLQGLSLVVVGVVRREVERYNEQLSLLCNAEGGRVLASRDERSGHEGELDARVQGIYRAHPAPPVERLRELEVLVQGVVDAHSLDPARWLWHLADTRTLSEYLDGLPTEGPGSRIAAAIQRQAVITNLRSLYTSEPASHYGVGAKPYARFSAPMREIVGVFVHKEILEKLGFIPPASAAEDELLRDRVIDAAARARDTQARLDHEVNRLVLDQLFSDDARLDEASRPVRVGTVMGVAPSKVHVQLDSPPLDVKLYLHDLEPLLRTTLSTSSNETLVLDASGHALMAVGDEITLKVVRRERERDRWILMPVSGLRATPSTGNTEAP